MEFSSRNTPDFTSPLLWPPNSPDLNPVDYEVWGVLQQRAYRTRIRDVDHLKQRLIEEWRCFDQNIIDRAVRQWRIYLFSSLAATVLNKLTRESLLVLVSLLVSGVFDYGRFRANSGHFEHKL